MHRRRPAVLPTRIAASGYIMGAAIQGALAYYQPFDTVIVNGRRVPNHPDDAAMLVLALVFAAVPFAIGLLSKCRQQRMGNHPHPRPRVTNPY